MARIFGFEIKKVKQSTKDKGIRFLKKSLIYNNTVILTYIISYMYLCYKFMTVPSDMFTQCMFGLFSIDTLGKAWIKVTEIKNEYQKGSTE